MKIRAQKNPPSIIYIDETWLKAHYSVCNVWQDTMVNENPAKAKMDNLSLGLRQPSGKGQRLIITHAGGNFGFVKNGLWALEQAKERLIIMKKWMLNILKNGLLSFCLSVLLSVCLSVCLSVYLSHLFLSHALTLKLLL